MTRLIELIVSVFNSPKKQEPRKWKNPYQLEPTLRVKLASRRKRYPVSSDDWKLALGGGDRRRQPRVKCNLRATVCGPLLIKNGDAVAELTKDQILNYLLSKDVPTTTIIPFNLTKRQKISLSARHRKRDKKGRFLNATQRKTSARSRPANR
jgi:hypothetical protein